MEEKLQAIGQELAMFQLNQLAKNNELERRVDRVFEVLGGKKGSGDFGLVGLAERVKVLEEARKVQIGINTQLLSAKEVKPVMEEKPKLNFWPWKH